MLLANYQAAVGKTVYRPQKIFGAAEIFFSTLRMCLYSRVTNIDSLYDIQSEIYPVPPDILEAAQDFSKNLNSLLTLIKQLEEILISTMDKNSENLESQTKSRFESIIKSLQQLCYYTLIFLVITIARLGIFRER